MNDVVYDDCFRRYRIRTIVALKLMMILQNLITTDLKKSRTNKYDGPQTHRIRCPVYPVLRKRGLKRQQGCRKEKGQG